MAEFYVESVMAKVTQVCESRGIGEAIFWDWLGNRKFSEDGGNLTIDRALFIIQNAEALLDEYLKGVKGGNE